ncbi:MAG: hypothetical protein DSM106950_43140 [Stigonema ocellatum SAG 48.90 = DSM 106950]|nr:hypothetical protein [Stigonema ocellatum SAG 48.90 = DSM 106950]
MLNHQIIINITPETAEKFASLSPEKQSQLKLLLGLELQELISPNNPKDSRNLTISQNTQYRGLTEEILGYLLEGDVKNQSHNQLNQKIIKKWRYLQDNHQELDPYNPLSDDEIEIIRQILIQHNQTRPLGVAKGELIIPDTFDSPLPDEILDLFYSP